jgi:hypothetical protein
MYGIFMMKPPNFYSIICVNKKRATMKKTENNFPKSWETYGLPGIKDI